MSVNQEDHMEDTGHEKDTGTHNASPSQDDSTDGWTYVTYKRKKEAVPNASDTPKSYFPLPNPRKAGQRIAKSKTQVRCRSYPREIE
ncbi:hypothetical protein HPB50_022680 [Hyalomma asiaticum]|uniref:Uncharacterized protein n=1 Tax=Hyalomma asiaticum TaxID=266040 RepID=A0ACB7T6C6_HYAAI|nr:hypothetical protein HPB50_022680 [Hyalomma asiaticum]